MSDEEKSPTEDEGRTLLPDRLWEPPAAVEDFAAESTGPAHRVYYGASAADEEATAAAVRRAPQRPRRLLPLLLFLLTLATTLFAGANYNLTAFLPDNILSFDFLNLAFGRQVLRRPELLLYGFSFAVPILLILAAHEMGHYLACRHYGIRATLPHFIPAPTLIGTFGAFIRIRQPIPHRRALFDIGVAGPLAGFALTLPALGWGIYLSRPVPLPLGSWYTFFGQPPAFKALAHLIHGPLPPGHDLSFHPLALAAWFGLLLTAFNLFPISQLDGGHMGYALAGRSFIHVSRGVFLVLLLLGFVYNGWLLWALVVFLLGFRHPPTLDDSLPPGAGRVLVGLLALVILLLSFTPRPFYLLFVE